MSAVLAHRAGADIKGKCVSLNTMALQDFGDDLRHAVVLENSLVVAELQIVECRHQGQMVAGQAFSDLAHANIFDAPVNAFAIVAKLQISRLT